jgi:hypothetical protein
MKLPAGDRAIVDMAKLRDYCLNRSHPVGKHKARVFAAALGLSVADAPILRKHLLRAALTADASEGSVDAFGRRFWIESDIVHGPKRAILRSAWMIRSGENVPRLITCYVQLS